MVRREVKGVVHLQVFYVPFRTVRLVTILTVIVVVFWLLTDVRRPHTFNVSYNNPISNSLVITLDNLHSRRPIAMPSILR